MTQMTVAGSDRTTTTVTLTDDSLTRTPAAALSARLCDLLSDGGRTVVVDVTALNSLSADVVSALLGARREATARGSRVVLRAGTARSRALLRRCTLDRVFTVVRDGDPGSMWRHG